MFDHLSQCLLVWRILMRIACLCALVAVGLVVLTGVRTQVALADTAASASDDAWAAVRAKLPDAVPVYRPTWLPARFKQVWLPSAPLPYDGVTYRSDQGDLLAFTFGGGNSAEPTASESVMVHGIQGKLVTTDSSPRIAVIWTEAGETYGIRGEIGQGTSTISRDELLQVVDSLVPVGADGTFAPQCFAETGKCATGRFLAYWLAHGGLAVNGYPLSGELDQQLADGQTYRVQYFERVRMEYHPENAAPYDILLGQFGRHLHPADPPVAQQPGATFFAATGHNVAPDFLAYWQAHGGLAQFGYPLSEELQETLEDGKTYTVQYFERARFERHPENQPPDDIELGQFGRRILAESGR